MKLADLFETRAQEQVHHNPSVNALKALARNNRYHSARFVITKDHDVVAGDSEHFTHLSMAPYMGAWEVRGYVQDMGDGEYAYRSMEVYSALNKDHPIFRIWERGGIQNGNPDQSHLTEAPIRATIYTHPETQGATIHMPKNPTQGVIQIPINKLDVWEPDTKFDQPEHAKNLKRIQAALKRGHQLPAIVVRKLGQRYQVLDGHHRLRAYKNLGMKRIPARVVSAQHVNVVSDPWTEHMQEAWSDKYKKSINCANPRGFSQRAHCAARKLRQKGVKTKSRSVHESVQDISSYNNWIRYTPESLHADWSEYVHKQDSKWHARAQAIGARWPLFTDPQQFKQALDQAAIVNVDELGDVENLTRNTSLQNIKDMVSGYQNPRDVDRIVAGLHAGVPLPLPIILKGDAGMWIQAGNTRQATSRVLGVTPRALLVDVRPS